jgi:hypothetical protein
VTPAVKLSGPGGSQLFRPLARPPDSFYELRPTTARHRRSDLDATLGVAAGWRRTGDDRCPAFAVRVEPRLIDADPLPGGRRKGQAIERLRPGRSIVRRECKRSPPSFGRRGGGRLSVQRLAAPAPLRTPSLVASLRRQTPYSYAMRWHRHPEGASRILHPSRCLRAHEI